MRHLLLLLAVLMATPASATEWINCHNVDNTASFNYLAGDGLDVLAISSLSVSAGAKAWGKSPFTQSEEAVRVGQAFADTQTIEVDAIDKSSVVIAELRLFVADDNDNSVLAGTLRVLGEGAWAVSCEGP